MKAVLLMMSVGVEYPALPSTVECAGVVGFILRLKAQVFSLILYNYTQRHYEGTRQVILCMSSDDKSVSRRSILKQAGATGALGLAGNSWLFR